MSVGIAGIGRTGFSKSSGRTTRAMAVEACRGALTDAGLGIEVVDGMCTFQVMDSAHPLEVAWALGRDDLSWANSMYGGGNLVADQIATAAAVIEAGLCRAVLGLPIAQRTLWPSLRDGGWPHAGRRGWTI